ncbi:MAG TPA: glycosyltransferase family 39 protein [Gemmataceae bacterium]|nr:glycosyltransferase family 39 protein [Gemmataceae bacterium]
MAAVIGGRMEAVVRQRSLNGADYARIAVLVAASLAVHLWLVAHTAVTARDSLGFARYALCIQSPQSAEPEHNEKRLAVEVIRKAQQAPGYPVCVWIAAKFVRNATTDMPHSESTLLAAQLVSTIAAALLVVPVYLIGRMLFGRFAGFSAALLFQVLPTPARITSDGLTEGVYLLWVAVAVLLGMRAVRKPGVGPFLLCGFAVGASYLVRLEGMMVAGAVGLVAAWMGLTRRWPRDVTLGYLTALAVGVALVAVPYMMLIGTFTIKPAPTQILNPNDAGRDPLKDRMGTSLAPVAGGPLFAAFWNDSAKGEARAEVVAAGMVAKEWGKSAFYAPLALAAFGLIALRKRVSARPEAWVLVVLAGVNVAVVMTLGTKVGYVSERHTLLLVLLTCVFAGASLEPLALCLSRIPKIGRIWAGKLAPAGLLLALVAAALPSTLKPLHPQREGHKHAGKWLKEHATNEDCVIDPFSWADWYAERTLYHIPPDPPDAKVLYTVLDSKTRPEEHTRLPRMALARDVAASGTVVYWWPENVPPEQASVKVYKTTR